MKILHIITRLIVGGAQENTLLTCEGLHVHGHEVILLTGPSPGPEGSLMPRAENTGYKVIVTPHLVRSPHPYHDVAAYREIQRLVRTLQPDIVHTHSSKAGILGRGAAWNVRQSKIENQKSKICHTIHGLPFHPYQNRIANRLWIATERWAAQRCDAIISVADAMTRQALQAGVGTAKGPDGDGLFTTIYSGMEIDPFLHPTLTREQIRASLHIPPTAFVYGTIARLQPLKGHDDLLSQLPTLFAQVPDAHLLWIGDGIFRDRFEKMIAENSWGGRITLTGLIPPTEVPQLLPAMDALVHPSYREGLARALPQALLAAVPVISYDCDGAREVCLDGQTGYLIPTGDAPALAAAMIKIAQDRPRARQMGLAGREFCLQRFDARIMVRQIEALYNRLLHPQAPASPPAPQAESKP